MDENDSIQIEKKIFNFKDYYDANPEFRQRHLEKQNTEAICECGAKVRNANISRHRKTEKHVKLMKTELEKKSEHQKSNQTIRQTIHEILTEERGKKATLLALKTQLHEIEKKIEDLFENPI